MTASPTTTIFEPSTTPLESETKHEQIDWRFSVTSESTLEHPEPKAVTWDGPDDPSNPQNWSYGYKWFVTLICGLLTLNVYVFFLPQPFILLYSSVG